MFLIRTFLCVILAACNALKCNDMSQAEGSVMLVWLGFSAHARHWLADPLSWHHQAW